MDTAEAVNWPCQNLIVVQLRGYYDRVARRKTLGFF